MFAYLTLQQHKSNLFLIGEQRQPDNRHIWIPTIKVPVLIEMFEGIIPPLNRAIDALERADNAG